MTNSLPILSLSVNEMPIIPKEYPFLNVTPVQMNLFKELQLFLVAIISRDPMEAEKEKRFCSDACLLRYLRATKWNVGNAMMRLKATLVWRRKYKPDEITMDDIKDQAVTGKQFLNGFDKNGHPILYLVPRRENSKDFEGQLRFIAFNLEKAIKMMPRGVEKMMIIVDYANMDFNNSPPLNVCKKFLKMIGDHYPERLANLFVVSPTWYLYGFAKIISPFLDPVTKSKIHFMNIRGEENSNQLECKGTGGWSDIKTFVSPDMLIKDYTGDYEFTWDFESYWKAMVLI